MHGAASVDEGHMRWAKRRVRIFREVAAEKRNVNHVFVNAGKVRDTGLIVKKHPVPQYAQESRCLPHRHDRGLRRCR
jgi:hypothetical protein